MTYQSVSRGQMLSQSQQVIITENLYLSEYYRLPSTKNLMWVTYALYPNSAEVEVLLLNK